MSGNRAVLVLVSICLLCPPPGRADEESHDTHDTIETDAEGELYRLPEAEVTETRDTPEHITREEMNQEGVRDLWEAVRYVPGVILSGGGRRGESNFTVRGFGTQDVPVFVDGVVLANPYRGEGDAARFLTGDIESVEIQKGFSTSLFGANTLGGAVIMRTAKPKDSLEFMFRTGLDFDSVMHYGDSTTLVSAGTKLKLFYGKAVFQYRDVNHFRLSEAFEPVSQNPQEKGDRLFSDSQDLKISLMAGLTPYNPLDIWLTWTYQEAHKGVSPPDIRVRESSPDFIIWDWPVWKRQSASLNGTFSQDSYSLSALFYFDNYDNRLDEYASIKHYELGIHAPHSDYDEYSLGGRITGKWAVHKWDELEAALTYKKEDHKGLKGGYSGFPEEDTMTEIVHINEDTWSLGAEWTANPWKPLTFKAGFGFNMLVPIVYWGKENEFRQWINAGYYTVQTESMFLYTWQAGVFYDINQHHQVHLTYARKNHFPNMSQRYSTRFGRNLPNPGLGPEIANHIESGYKGTLLEKFSINTALYYSVMIGKIVEVEVPDPDHPSFQLNYARNLDSTTFYGFEAAPEFIFSKYISCALTFSLNKYVLNHRQDEAVTSIPYYPEITINAYAQIKPVPKPLSAWPRLRSLTVIPRIEYIGNRWTNSAGTEELEGYFLAHLKVSANITAYYTFSMEIDNLFDAYYEIRYNSPMAGRTFNLMVTLQY